MASSAYALFGSSSREGTDLVGTQDPIDGEMVAGLKYDELPDDVRIVIDTYSLDIITMDDTDEDEVREMFLRLQNGTTLKAQERRTAMPGRMRDFIKEIGDHDFFERVAFKDSRYAFDHVAAQMTAIELNGGPCHVRNSHLNKMYEEYQDFDSSCSDARKIRRVLDTLCQIFPEKTPELERYSVISL